MKLTHVRVTKYRCIEDSSEVAIEPDITALIGRNESGKTAFLEAMRRLNAADGSRFDVTADYPRAQLGAYRRRHARSPDVAVTAKLVLDDAEVRAQVGFSNLYALPLPELAGRHWRARDVWVTTPAAPPHGIALTATHYNGRLSFNFNYKASVISEADVLALAETFIAELRTVGTINAELVVD